MPMVARRNDNDSTCGVLPQRYVRFQQALEESFEPKQARAIAKMLCEIDAGAGEVTALRILEEEGGFDPEQAKSLAEKALFLRAVKKLLMDDAA